MSVVNFKILDVEAKNVDATADVTTDAFPFCNSHDWAVTILDNGVVGGPPTFTVEVSNNKTKWYNWDTLSTGVDIVNSVDGDHMTYAYMRIIYLANGTSAGTVDFELSLFNNKF